MCLIGDVWVRNAHRNAAGNIINQNCKIINSMYIFKQNTSVKDAGNYIGISIYVYIYIAIWKKCDECR